LGLALRVPRTRLEKPKARLREEPGFLVFLDLEKERNCRSD
jgi:hypothetical protein